MKLAVIIPVHCDSSVAKLTIGSFIRTHREHKLNIHVGVHSNYADYTRDLSLFDDIKDVAQIHCVDEIDWLSEEYNSCWYRYSVMHCKNLVNLFHNVKNYLFDYLVILDHDLFVMKEFVSKCVGVDLTGALFEDRDCLHRFKTLYDNETIYSVPKISAWHTIISMKLFDKVMEDINIIYPKIVRSEDRFKYLRRHGTTEDLPVFLDTFAEILYKVQYEWSMTCNIFDNSTFSDWVEHFFCSSFNYGERTLQSSYHGHIDKIRNIYNREFPNGFTL